MIIKTTSFGHRNRVPDYGFGFASRPCADGWRNPADNHWAADQPRRCLDPMVGAAECNREPTL